MKTTTEMQLVPITKLVPYVNNARTHSPEQINKLRSSLREFGFINPVIVTSSTPRPGRACYNGGIHYGNHRTHNRNQHSARS